MLSKYQWLMWERKCEAFIREMRKEIKSTKQSNQSVADDWWVKSDDNKKICKVPDLLTDAEFTDTQKHDPFWR